jgi:hypothetical protein
MSLARVSFTVFSVLTLELFFGGSPAGAVNPSVPNPANLNPGIPSQPPPLIGLEKLVGDDAMRSVVDETDDLGSKIPDVLYGAISHYGVTLFNTPHINGNLSFGRDVFDNRSALGTWTVSDQIGFSFNIPIFSSAPLMPPGLNMINFFIGTNDGIVVTDIRQVTPHGYFQLPPMTESIRQIKENDQFKNFLVHNQSGRKAQWMKYFTEAGEKITSFFLRTPQNYARFSSMWNIFLTPFKIPFNKSIFSRLQIGEIITYEGQGSIQSGLGIGWSLDPTSLIGILNAGVSLSAFSRGIYRIAILKTGEFTAKIKVIKTGSLGTQATLGGGYTPGILDNLLIISSLNNQIQVIPIQITYQSALGTSHETTYEYDLQTQTGEQAYESAVLGNFKPSDDLAIAPEGQWRTSTSETGVMRVGNLHSTSHSASLASNMQLGFIYKQKNNAQVNFTECTLTTHDGRKRNHTALAQNSKEWGLIFNQYQKYQHNFLVNLDLDECEKNPASCENFPLHLEGRIDDSATTQAALLHYILEVENALGIPDFFPRSPEIRDLRTFSHDPYHPFYFYHPGHNLGGSHFYYQLKLSETQVRQIIDYPEDQMWPALEQAFQISPGSWSSEPKRWLYAFSRAPVSFVDLFLSLFQMNWKPGTDLVHAENTFQHWKKIKTIKEPKKRAEALVETFFDSIYSKYFPYLIRALLANQEVEYYVSGSNKVFGNITHQGKTRLAFEDLASKLASQIQLKQTTSPEEEDPELQISRLELQETRNGDLQLFLNTPIQPDSFYMDLTLDDWTSLTLINHVIFAKVFKNPGLPKELNPLELNAHDRNSPFTELAYHIKPNTRYLLRFAISKDGKKWGKVSQTHLRAIHQQHRPLHPSKPN